MLEVEMTDDIRKYKAKALGRFTLRQTAYVAIGLVVGIIVALLVPLPITLRLTFGLIIVVPFALCGFVTIGGCTFEVILIKWVYSHILTPQKRKVIIKNPYREEYKDYEERRKQYYLKNLPEDKKKRYQEMLEHEKKRIVKESDKPQYRIYR